MFAVSDTADMDPSLGATAARLAALLTGEIDELLDVNGARRRYIEGRQLLGLYHHISPASEVVALDDVFVRDLLAVL